MRPQSILHFWFEELATKQRFAKDAVLNETIRVRFAETLEGSPAEELAFLSEPASAF